MIPCPQCKADLPEAPFIGHWVVCLNCEHSWELNDENTAVKSVTIEIKRLVTEISASQILKGK